MHLPCGAPRAQLNSRRARHNCDVALSPLPSASSQRRSSRRGAIGLAPRLASSPAALPPNTDPFMQFLPDTRRPLLLISQPNSLLDVDHELWQVLDLCSDEELELIYDVLHSNSPFSPVVKSLVAENEPAMVELRGRVSVMHKVESRFRFLAADSACLLQGKRPGYRETLMAIRDRVNVPCSGNLSTYDLETEIFLHVMQHCLEYVQGNEGLDPAEAAAVASTSESDGMGGARPKGGSNWVERVTAPLRFGLQELLPTALKFGSAMTVTVAGQRAAQQLATQLVSSHLRYQAAAKVATGLARGAVAGWSKTAVLEAAQKGLTLATARYSALQGALSFLGPVMWGAFAVDLALKAIGTDYARVVRAVFILAQIRLVRTRGFTNPDAGGSGAVQVLGAMDGGASDDDVYGDPGAAY